MKRIVLASASPRRSELLTQIGIEFDIVPSNIEEIINTNLTPQEVVEELAYKKALDVAKKLKYPCIVIGADTIVVKESILGKPESKAHALEMLKGLGGQWHDVITGVSIIDTSSLKNGEKVKALTEHEKTRVKMRDMSDQLICAYIDTGEPLDKAGSYGIQGMGALLVEKIEGCYFNVVGLPLLRLSNMLERFGMCVLGNAARTED